MVNLPTNKVLVFDIETDSLDIATARLRYFGAYSFATNERYYLKGDKEGVIEYIKEMISNHDAIVTFNGKRFDVPILNNYGVYFTGKPHIDLWEVLSEAKLDLKTRTRTGGKGRGEFLGLKLNSWSLASIVKALQLGEYKMEGFDHSILKKESEEWTKEEEQLIVEYLVQDITITKRLFEYVNNFFFPFTEHLSEINIKKFAYITSSIAALAYKIICHEAKLVEEYGDEEKDWEYEGGYVRYPSKESHIGGIVAFDFNSLYPSIFRTFNLFSPAPEDYPEENVFTGNDFFTVKGRYKKDEQGVVEQVIAKLYKLRLQYKRLGDRREYLIKIIINALYGITAKPIFKSIFYRYSAEDCTSIGRQMIKYAADHFTKQGFEVLYGDTDSVYVGLGDKTTDDAIKTAKEIEQFLLMRMPFPNMDFGFKLDAEIKAMFFFPIDKKTYMKKNYVYVTKQGSVEIVGLPIIKSNASTLATTILNKYLIPIIKEKLMVKFNRGYFQQLIYYELEQDITLAAQVYKVRDVDYYKVDSDLHCQISRKYGSGTHSLIPNTRFGVGLDKHYCTIEEFVDKKLRIQDVDLTVTWSNLAPFIKDKQKNLGDF
jgi:DNA polymerase elongation subunit (family B)